MQRRRSSIRTVCIIGALLAFVGLSAAAHDRELIRTITPVVDLHLTTTGQVRLYTQDFFSYVTDASRDAWIPAPPSIIHDTSMYSIRRIGRVVHLNEVVLAGGHVISTSSGQQRSAVLRSEDEGRTFSVIEIGTDTLASADDLRQTQDGMVFFLDRVGRIWTSLDKGLSWNVSPLPKPIPPGGARELDMITRTMGICVDVGRSFYFTANGWQSVISPMISQRPIVRTQPTFLDYFAWSRELTFWNNTLILREGRDLFRSASNDLLWERWAGVGSVAMAPDRSTLCWWTTDGKLWQASTFDAPATEVASGVLQPELLRIDGDAVIAYRPDTGPIVFRGGSRTVHRPYHATATITSPTIGTDGPKGTNWGVRNVLPGAIVVDILREDKSGVWHRDTVLPIGPTFTVRKVGKDTVVFGDFSNKHALDLKTRRITSYDVRQPLTEFLKSPVARFRCQVAADELDSTHVKWTEFRLVDGVFRCAELVDSSRFGVRSDLVDIRISQADVSALLQQLNARGDAEPTVNDVAITPELRADFDRMLDTLFVHDAYFDVFDIYRPPPAPEVQAIDCRAFFKRMVDSIPQLTPQTLAAAMLAWRRVPKDEFSRYAIEFENRSGRFLSFSVEREDEAHPPLMAPWVGSYAGWKWHVFDRGLTGLFLQAMPEQGLPPLFREMSREVWFLAAVCAYLDGQRNGRWHRWTEREVTPGARQ